MRLTAVALTALLASGFMAPPALAQDTRAEAPAGQGSGSPSAEAASAQTWLAGDHHIHSRYSVGWEMDPDDPGAPPAPIIGGDAIYPIPMNAVMAKRYGLSWMVATDHGGPNHSKVNLELAYPELLLSREAVPEVIQFFGMEFDTPGGDHSSIIVPHTHDEAHHLHELESRFSSREPWPSDVAWNQESRTLEALRVMDSLPEKPLLIAHHPSRSARSMGAYGRYDPAEFRAWNDLAPEVAVGMEGAPGHQAATLERDGSVGGGSRGGYGRAPTVGGFDQMTARLGGFWDSMLGEGRRWWITANSDSHVHWREGGSDFWPGEYSKTYVLADRNHDAIIEGIRQGRVFVTLGDLVSEVWVTLRSGDDEATLGEALEIAPGADVAVEIRVRDPAGPNHGGRTPSVSRIDLITGEVHGLVEDPTTDTNPSTRVAHRFDATEWQADGEWLVMAHVLEGVHHDGYLRLRGTNGSELEPAPDPPGEDPWADLWFYTNPIFIEVAGGH